MDELYVAARGVLLDALDALEAHRDAIILVGAQALYLHTGDADLAVAPYTTDGDLALDPSLLSEIPPIEQALSAAGFVPDHADHAGSWLARRRSDRHDRLTVAIDLLVPESVSPGGGRRAARLPGHAPMAARKVRGLEGALVDREAMIIRALEGSDLRSARIRVAGPGALLVAKLHKISERGGSARANDKDALDVFRLLRAVPTAPLAERLNTLLADGRSAEAAARSLGLLSELFGRGGVGTIMAARALEGVLPASEVRLSCTLMAEDLLTATSR